MVLRKFLSFHWLVNHLKDCKTVRYHCNFFKQPKINKNARRKEIFVQLFYVHFVIVEI